EGPVHGRRVVLLHGATVPHWEFDELTPFLVTAGLRVLRFDLFGHGLSDRPSLEYSLQLFVRQTIELIEAAQFARPVTLLGHSVGAAIGCAVAAARPDWVERVVLVAPMLDFTASNKLTALLALPLFGELLAEAVVVPALVRRRRRRYGRMGLPHLIE